MEATQLDYHHKIIIVLSKHTPMRIHSVLFRETLMAIGYDQDTANTITVKGFRRFFRDCPDQSEVVVPKHQFTEWLTETHIKHKLEVIKRLKSYFYAIIKLRLKQQGIVILIGGASGSGKSSLTSLLAGRLHLKQMSSDNIRHIMRNFVSKSESPFIFSSTYDSYHLIKDEGKSLQERTIEAYLLQCKAVQKELKKVLEYYYKSGVWVIVEGVHCTPEFILDCMKTFKSCFGCIVHVDDPEKYKNRFASRSSKNSIKPEDNKYIAAFDKILMIQSYLVKEADLKKIPRIQNTNLDTCVGLVHRSFLKNLRLIQTIGTLINTDEETAEKFHHEFQNTYELFKKAKKIKEYMKMGHFGSTATSTELTLSKSKLVKDHEDKETFIQRMKSLEPFTAEKLASSLLVLPEVMSPSWKQAVQAHIESIERTCPRKLHLVHTSRRTLVFMTDEHHTDSRFITEHILDATENIQSVITDQRSHELLFRDIIQVHDKKRNTTHHKISLGRRDSGSSNESFESVKRKQVLLKSSSKASLSVSDQGQQEEDEDQSIEDRDSASDIKEDEAYDQEEAEEEESPPKPKAKTILP